jgi:hypothetical protein
MFEAARVDAYIGAESSMITSAMEGRSPVELEMVSASLAARMC